MYKNILCNDELVYKYNPTFEVNQLERIFSELGVGKYCPRSVNLNSFSVDYPIKKALREAYPTGTIDWAVDELVLCHYQIRKLKRFLEGKYMDSLYEQYSNLFMFYEGGQIFYQKTKESEPMYQRYTYVEALNLPNDPDVECKSLSPLHEKIDNFNWQTDFFFCRMIDAIVAFEETHPNLENYRFCGQ